MPALNIRIKAIPRQNYELTQPQYHEALELYNQIKNARGAEVSYAPEHIQSLVDAIMILSSAYRRACEAANWDEERADEELGNTTD